MIAYKVLRLDRAGLTSCISRWGMSVSYEPGVWTRPCLDGSRLFVYGDKTLADKLSAYLAYRNQHTVIFTCEVKDPIPCLSSYSTSAARKEPLSRISHFWKMRHYADSEAWFRDEYNVVIRQPAGSFAVSSVKLCEEVIGYLGP